MKKVIKTLCFLLGVCIIICGLQHVFIVSDYRVFHTVKGFYEERENALDAVYIGASNVYPFYEAPLAWRDYGIAVYPLSVPAMPSLATKHMIIEARKTQPDALYIVCLNNFKDDTIANSHMHYLSNHMPLSKNKIDLINAYGKQSGKGWLELLEFYLPFIRFHSSWNELDEFNFNREVNGYKSASYYPSFLKKSEDISAYYVQTEDREPLPEHKIALLNDLLDYCDSEKVNVLFVFALQGVESPSVIKQFNTIEDIVTERGYPVLNAMEKADEIGITFSQDYYNANHTNIHGSFKMTDYTARYLIDNYGFEDKRGAEGYESWDASVEAYTDRIDAYCFDFELNSLRRDFHLKMPEHLEAVKSDSGWTVSWSEVESADGYYVYKRTQNEKGKKSRWAQLQYTEELSITDSELEDALDYAYTVVPVRNENGVQYFGEAHLYGVGDMIKSITCKPAPIPDEVEVIGGKEE